MESQDDKDWKWRLEKLDAPSDRRQARQLPIAGGKLELRKQQQTMVANFSLSSHSLSLHDLDNGTVQESLTLKQRTHAERPPANDTTRVEGIPASVLKNGHR